MPIEHRDHKMTLISRWTHLHDVTFQSIWSFCCLPFAALTNCSCVGYALVPLSTWVTSD